MLSEGLGDRSFPVGCRGKAQVGNLVDEVPQKLKPFGATITSNGSPYGIWDRCPVLSVCNVGVLWPNSWMDQDTTW